MQRTIDPSNSLFRDRSLREFGVQCREPELYDGKNQPILVRLLGGASYLIQGQALLRFRNGVLGKQLSGEPLLQPVMRRGGSVTCIELEESRRRFPCALVRLPDHLRKLDPSPAAYPVSFSECLRSDLTILRAEVARGALNCSHRFLEVQRETC